MIFIITPNLLDRVNDFFRDLEIQEISSKIYLPAPKSDHPIFFKALYQFCFYFAILQVPILVARFILKDPADKKAGTISGLIFWFGAAWLIDLLVTKDVNWFKFLGFLIALIGISIVIMNVISLGAQASRK